MSGRNRLLSALVLAGLALACLPPGSAVARQSMSFRPGDRARTAAPARRVAHRHRPAVHAAARSDAHGRRHRGIASSDGDEGSAAVAVPGAGFTMQDGVLTYPAPARFQPKNLRHR